MPVLASAPTGAVTAPCSAADGPEPSDEDSNTSGWVAYGAAAFTAATIDCIEPAPAPAPAPASTVTPTPAPASSGMPSAPGGNGGNASGANCMPECR